MAGERPGHKQNKNDALIDKDPAEAAAAEKQRVAQDNMTPTPAHEPEVAPTDSSQVNVDQNTTPSPQHQPQRAPDDRGQTDPNANTAPK